MEKNMILRPTGIMPLIIIKYLKILQKNEAYND